MICPNCHQHYSHELEKTPRLLINCGHTVCFSCLDKGKTKMEEDSENFKINCPECQITVEFKKVEDLPKNLALLNSYNSVNSMQETLVAQTEPGKLFPLSDIKSARNKLDDMSSLSSYNPEDREYHVCPEHCDKENRFEAYCEKTKKLLCINCILEEQHKNYTLVSIKDGYAKEKSKLIDTESKLKELGNKIEGKLQEISTHNESLHQKMESRISDAREFFRTCRELINKREKEYQEELAQSIGNEERKVNCLKKSLICQQEGLKKIDTIIDGMKEMDANEFLSKTANVYGIIASNLKEIKDEKLTFIVKNFRPEQEIGQIYHQIQCSIKSKNKPEKTESDNIQPKNVLSRKESKYATKKDKSMSRAHRREPSSKIYNNKRLSSKMTPKLGHKLPSKKVIRGKKSNQNSKNSSKVQSKNSSFQKSKNGIDYEIANLESEVSKSNLMAKRREKIKSNQNLLKISDMAAFNSVTATLNDQVYNSNRSKGSQNHKSHGRYGHSLEPKPDRTPKISKKELAKGEPKSRGRTHLGRKSGLGNRRDTTKGRFERSKTPPKKKKYGSIHNSKKEKENLKPKKNEIPGYAKPTKNHDIRNRNRNLKHQGSRKDLANDTGVLTNNVNIYNVNVNNQGQSSRNYGKINNLEKARALKRARNLAKKKNSASLVTSNKDDLMAELDRNLRKVELQMEKPHTKRPPNVYKLDLNDAKNMKTPQLKDKLSTRRQHRHQMVSLDCSDTASIMSMNKKFIVESQLNNPASTIKLVNINFDDLKTLKNPVIYLIGGYGTDPNTELSVSKFSTIDNKFSDLGFSCGRVKSCSVKLPNGSIWLIGGKSRGHRLQTILEINPDMGTTKLLDIKLNRAKCGSGAILINKKIYLVGGNAGEQILKEVEIIDIETHEVTRGPDLSVARDEMGVTIGSDGQIYAIGGFGGEDHSYLQSAEKLDIKTNSWTPIANMKKKRRSMCTVSLPDGIYCTGGFDGDDYLKCVERYSIEKNEWISLSETQIERCFATAIGSLDNQYIYLFGGYRGEPLDSVERYSVIENKWETVGKMTQKRFMHTAIICNKIGEV